MVFLLWTGGRVPAFAEMFTVILRPCSSTETGAMQERRFDANPSVGGKPASEEGNDRHVDAPPEKSVSDGSKCVAGQIDALKLYQDAGPKVWRPETQRQRRDEQPVAEPEASGQ